MAARRKGLAPIEDTQVVEETPQQPTVDSGRITNDSNIDSYLTDNVPEFSDEKFSLKDAEIEVLNEKIKTLEMEKANLQKENRELLEKIGMLLKESNDQKNPQLQENVESLKSEMAKLKNYNDSLILKNSELEFENARITETIKNVQSKKDSQLHTYTNPGYSGKGGFVPAKNGYQDWR